MQRLSYSEHRRKHEVEYFFSKMRNTTLTSMGEIELFQVLSHALIKRSIAEQNKIELLKSIKSA